MINNRTLKRPYVVGIGASAGGLEALEKFFQAFPTNSGLSFVVIQHLSPDFKSLMVELLARHTDMNIYRVDETVTIKPNCIYLIPPKKNLSIKGSKLIPSDQDPSLNIRLPIDSFFTSLAKQYESNAIAVILSGTGSDGTRGAASIKEREGFVLAQDPATCKFDGMPKSVIKQGIPDKMGSPEQLVDIILKYTRYSYGGFEYIDLEKESDKFRVVTSLLQTIEGLDFASYRPATIARRIERRVKINHLKSLDEYIHLLRSDVKELRFLHGELLIGVTRFFRNTEAFEHLKKVIIPRIIEEARDDNVIRVWTPGCSTGQEPYSVAMCFLEYFSENKIIKDLKIFATDVDREALEIASAGKYPDSVMEEIGEERMMQFFVKGDSYCEVKSKLRRVIIFSHHNTVKDPPFTNMHLISCRNLLIYFQTNLQARAISLFHFGLKNNGILFLGKSEALGELAPEFNTLQPTLKFFQKLRDVKLAMVSEINMAARQYSGARNVQPLKQQFYQDTRRKEPGLSPIYEKLLRQYVPPGILMDENYQLLHTFGDASQYLDVPKGKSTFNILKMLDQDISVALSTAVGRAIKTEQEVHFKEISRSTSGGNKFNIKVRPFPVAYPNQLRKFMVLFEEIKSGNSEDQNDAVDIQVYNAQIHVREQVTNLEEQLLSTRESLQATIEELETTNEELQSTNEELMSSNEELQSSNEELQSVNEELYTVNTEHQSKIDELTQANNDIDFLLKSSNIGTMFLDEDLRIRRYNQDIQSIVNVMPHDVGRPITDITFNFAHDRVVAQILKVARAGKAYSFEIVHRGVAYLVKSMPYRMKKTLDAHKGDSYDNKNGVVLSFMDVSSLNEAKELKRLTEDAEEFNFVVSHDLRKPLRHLTQAVGRIHGAIESKQVDKSKLHSEASEVTNSVEELTAMLDSLLKYSRLRTRGSQFTKFKPLDIVNTVREEMRTKLKNVDLKVENLPNSIRADAEQFSDLLKNLFQNIIDHCSGTKGIEITFTAKQKDDFWEFSVGDNGPGLKGIDAKKAFEIFYKNSPDGNDDKSRLGVGLAYSKRIIDRHGGEIWIEDNNLSGVTVSFTMPEYGQPRV